MSLVYEALAPMPLDAKPAAAPLTPARLGVIVLTFNSESVIERTLRAAQRVSEHVFVVDSCSNDRTPAIARALGCEVVQRPFVHYADQRNWAIDTFGPRLRWQLHLDADEVLDARACDEILRVLREPGAADGFILRRRTYFLGRALRFGGASNYQLRLFRTGTARCEDRLYDQHFVAEKAAVQLGGWLHDMNVGSLSEWTARHNRWSDLEAEELARPDGDAAARLAPRLSRDPRERRRFYKGRYYAAPPLWRALLLFAYRYFVQGGFLDGRAGFFYAFFQALWFRMLVDAKLHERRVSQ